MPTLNVSITVAEALNGLGALADLRAVESYKELAETDCFEADALVSVDSCIDVAENEGYVDVDDLHPNLRDLSDGLRALMDGDKQMATAMLSRALHEWPDAARVIEDVLMGRTHRDRRQAVLALAA